MQVIARFDDFSKGHYGDDPFRSNGWFGGYNFITMPNGSARIREGTTLFSTTGLPNSTAMAIAPGQGGIFYASGTATWGLWNDGVSAPSSLTALTATVSSNASGTCPYRAGSLFTNLGDATYKVDTGYCTKLTGSPGGNTVAVLGDRIYVGGISGNPNRIRWSDAANENSWTSLNFLDIGVNTSEGIVLMRRQRDSLIIATKEPYSGAATHWYRLSGTPNVNQTLTPIVGQGPQVRDFSNQINDGHCEGYGNRVWFLPYLIDSGSSATVAYGNYGWIDSDVPHTVPFRPEVHNGAGYGSLPSYSVAGSLLTPSALFLHRSSSSLNRVAYVNDNTWADLEFSVSTAVGTPTVMSVCTCDGGFVLARSGDGSNKAEFQMWWPTRNIWNAPVETDRSGAATVSGELHTPIWLDPGHNDHLVQAVEVDYRAYSANTAMSCVVQAHGVYNQTYAASSTVAAPAISAPAAAGDLYSYRFPVSPLLSGRGFQVRLTSCKAIAIQAITVLGETNDPRV